jgi:DNA-binding IclR family transcriptional regulator
MRKRRTEKSATVEALSAAPEVRSSRDSQFNQAIARAFAILRSFHDGETALTNKVIALRTGLPQSTVSRLAYTLLELGYLTYSEQDATYRLGSGVVALASPILSGLGFRHRARELMQDLANESQATVALGGRQGLRMVYLEVRHSREVVLISCEVGMSVRLATTAIGRAYLHALPEPERAPLLSEIAEASGDDWPSVKARIDQSFADIDAYGFCVSIGEFRPEINVVAAPLHYTPSGDVYAINCGGPASLVTPKRMETRFGPRLVEISHEIALSDAIEPD